MQAGTLPHWRAFSRHLPGECEILERNCLLVQLRGICAIGPGLGAGELALQGCAGSKVHSGRRCVHLGALVYGKGKMVFRAARRIPLSKGESRENCRLLRRAAGGAGAGDGLHDQAPDKSAIGRCGLGKVMVSAASDWDAEVELSLGCFGVIPARLTVTVGGGACAAAAVGRG